MVGPGEKVTYASSFSLSGLPRSSTYVVRFIVFINYLGLYLRWRYTAGAIRSPAKDTALPMDC